MLISSIVAKFNEKLAGEMLSRNEAVLYLDEVIDDINTDLSTNYPAFSEFNYIDYPNYKYEQYTTIDPTTGATVIDIDKRNEVYNNYDLFPDKYIRRVVIPGAASKWFGVDEEGAFAAPLFNQDYEKERFKMLRDYVDQVGDNYVDNNRTGSITDPTYYDRLDSASDLFGMF